MESIKRCLVLALLGLAITWPGTATAQRDGTHGAEAATDPLSGSGYFMSSVTGDIPGNKTTSLSIESNGNDVDWFSVKVDWDSTEMSLSSWEATYFLETTIGIDTFTVSQTANSIVLTFELTIPQDLTEGGSLVEFHWSTPCQEDGSVLALTLPNPDVDNVFSLDGGGTYRPASVTDGSVTLLAYTGDIWPTDVSGAVGTNIKVPLLAVNNFDPIGGITATVVFDTTGLTYQSFDTVGTWAGGVGDITITTSADTLFIDDDGYYSETDTIVWFYLVFRNIMSDTGETATVTVDEWEQTGDCAAASVGEVANDSASVSTPAYVADLYWQDNFSLKVNETKPIAVQMTNNFYIKMSTTANDSIASFRVDAHKWSKLDSTSVTPDSVVRSGSVFQWQRLTGTADTIWVFQEHTGKPSDTIPPASARSTVSKLEITAKGSTGTQSVNFLAESDSTVTNYYEKDSKITASSPAGITLHSTTVGSDSLFRLHGNTVTITSGGGGGSCPFVYSWDGSRWALEDVILTECEKLPETTPVKDLLTLTYPPARIDGTYRIRIHEHEAEKSFVDNVELLMVDHLPGYDASVDLDGDIVFGKDRLLPVSAMDDWGEDVLSLVAADDGEKFIREGGGSLVVTYRGRSGANYAIASAGEPKPSCKLWAGPQPPDVIDPFGVRMEVEDVHGTWHPLPMGPVRLPQAHARPFVDLSDLNLGGTFRLRYSWSEHAEFDELSVILQEPVAYKLSKSPVVSVTHSSDDWTGSLVTRQDGKYAELVTGEYVDLQFSAPPVPEGKKRSFILATSGYYLSWYGELEGNRPLHFGLNGNYPNPFNPSTTIRYSLAAEVPVTLEIFNILGQRVRTLLAAEVQLPGAYEVSWDGTDEKGVQVGSGVYLYSLRAGEFTESRKMIMVK